MSHEPMRPSRIDSEVKPTWFSQPGLCVGESRFQRQTNDARQLTRHARWRTDRSSFVAQTVPELFPAG